MFSYVQDLARLFVWVLKHYDEIDPIILSGIPQRRDIHTYTCCIAYMYLVFTLNLNCLSLVLVLHLGLTPSLCNQVCYHVCYISICLLLSIVGEADEVSIRDVAYMVADAMDFKGEIMVRELLVFQCSISPSS